MKRSRGRSIVLGAIITLALTQLAPAAAAQASKPLRALADSPYRRLPSDFAGFNTPFRLNSWQVSSPHLHDAAAALRPGALRVFGGTTANYWNWRTGKFFDRRGVPPRLRRVSREMSPIHLSDWAGLVRGANATPVFDLNLVTSSLSDQLAMLEAADALGMPVRRIELGNELYYPAPLVVRAFPTPEAYGRTATRWIDAIEAEFPETEVAAVGFGYGPKGVDRRLASWDRRVQEKLRGESALTFHAYWDAPRTRRLSGARLADALAEPLRLLAKLRRRGLERLPEGVSAWITEWNVWHGAKLRGTWANGLADAAYLVGLLGERSVTQEDLHPLVHSQPHAALFGNPLGFHDGPGTVRYAPTAVGEAIGQLYPALRGGARVRRLRLRHAPRIAGTRLAAVRGVALEGGGALLVNLGGRRRTVDLPVGLSCDGTLSSVWARPSARITGHPGKVDRRTRHTRGRLILPRHSVSRLSC
jgi:hypothetical protein